MIDDAVIVILIWAAALMCAGCAMAWRRLR
jgi:hypothetical protein